MLTNFRVRPDKDGDQLQRYAAEILSLDQHAVIPHDSKEARRMLEELRQSRGALVDSPNDRRLGQFHEVYNAMLPRLALARRLGIRPANAKPPGVPFGGIVTEDELNSLREIREQLDIDIEIFEGTTAEQRRIMKLETRMAAVCDHANKLVDALSDSRKRVERLEAIIKGPQAL